ncbi:MAG: penicillin acylase family protein, partial [Chloroflexota bacterium]
DYQRRLVRGELAAVLGPRVLASDRAMRTLGMAAAGDRAWETESDDVRAVLEALAAGINRWTEQVRSRLPIEFEVLGYEPRPWRPADSIAIWKHRAWTLTGRLEQIAAVEAARHLLPADLLEAFLTVELADERIVPGASAEGNPGGAFGEGSNNWVVGGAHTTTGAPVLCSDPHNQFNAPSQWFEAQLSCPAFDAAGAVYLGTPALYLGRNREVAWGLTNHAVSVRDLYVEETSPAQPGRYREGGAWRAFDVERQSITVAGQPEQSIEIRRTARGPIVDELLPSLDGLGIAGPISLRWLGAEVPSGFDATLGLLRARSAADVREALRTWPCPPLNFVYADRAGDFGYHAAGLVPRRERTGYELRSASEPADAWHGFLDFDELPSLANPARGWLATANNVPGAANRAYLAGGAWSDGYRAQRIRERITAKDKLTPEEVAAIHGDVRNARARVLVPALLKRLGDGDTPIARQAVQALQEWDAEHTTASVGASIWTAFWSQWCLRLARARFPAALVDAVALRVGEIGRRLLLGESLGWFSSGTPDQEIRQTFTAALEALQKAAGPDVRSWRWGDLHRVTHPHPLGTTAGLREIFNTGPYPTSGGTSIVRAAGHGSSVPFDVVSGSTYRFLADLSKPDRIESTQTLGQSAHLGSPHYRDQTQLWLDNRYHPLWMAPADVLAHLESEVVIEPERA